MHEHDRFAVAVGGVTVGGGPYEPAELLVRQVGVAGYAQRTGRLLPAGDGGDAGQPVADAAALVRQAGERGERYRGGRCRGERCRGGSRAAAVHRARQRLVAGGPVAEGLGQLGQARAARGG